MKPLLPYYGGKQRIASWILEYIPPHTVYAEPFAGGAAVLFAKGLPPGRISNFYREALNDNLEIVVNFYRVAKTQPDQLMQRIAATPYARSEYNRAKAVMADPAASDLDRAWAFIVLNAQSFASKYLGGWGVSLINQNDPYTWHRKKETIKKALFRVDKIYLDHSDALDFIARWDTPHTVFYCDPPYPGTYQGHYNGYTAADFNRLAQTLDNISGSFVLSCYDFEGQVIPDHWRRVTRKTKTSAANGRARADFVNDRLEVLYIMDRSAGTRPDLKPHLWTPAGGYVYRQHRQRSLFAANGGSI